VTHPGSALAHMAKHLALMLAFKEGVSECRVREILNEDGSVNAITVTPVSYTPERKRAQLKVAPGQLSLTDGGEVVRNEE
jgi:hypothetical protein